MEPMVNKKDVNGVYPWRLLMRSRDSDFTYILIHIPQTRVPKNIYMIKICYFITKLTKVATEYLRIRIVNDSYVTLEKI